jgi:hypothetical protein
MINNLTVNGYQWAWLFALEVSFKNGSVGY